MTVLIVCTVVLMTFVVRDRVSEEGFCRVCGGACLTLGEAETREDVVPCSRWKKEDMARR